ncbi:MAG: hypothetical protein KQH59_06495 [Desulfobulbaceae bacterium]|nr:hypothetical protein [Desulfobulbaceae bacterium]
MTRHINLAGLKAENGGTMERNPQKKDKGERTDPAPLRHHQQTRWLIHRPVQQSLHLHVHLDVFTAASWVN